MPMLTDGIDQLAGLLGIGAAVHQRAFAGADHVAVADLANGHVREAEGFIGQPEEDPLERHSTFTR